jgi:protease I
MKWILSLLIILLGGCSINNSKQQEVLDMSSVLMVVAPTDFRDEEFFEPRKIIEDAGFNVIVASKGVSIAKGKLGASTKVDIDISKVNTADYVAVVFVGGPGAEKYFNDSQAHRIAKEFDANGKIVSAICAAPGILAYSGVLKGHKATSFESYKSIIQGHSEGYTGEIVTIDGNIITANGPAAATKFGTEIVKNLKSRNINKH